MDTLIPNLYKEYGNYINSFRAFPLEIDGLKPVERRVLLSTYLIAKNKNVKSARVEGHTIGNLHPHGSIYTSLVQLVNQGLIIGQGNFGSRCGASTIGAAAMRYTEVRSSPFINQIAFKYIDYVDWEINELGEKEPNYLPTQYPLCLCGLEYTQGIGFGYKTTIPCYNIEDLKKRLKWLVSKDNKNDHNSVLEPVISPITDCLIKSDTKVLKELLTSGSASIEVSGIIEENKKAHQIIIKSWPTGKTFQSILNKLSTELDRQDIGYTDSSVTSTEIIFTVLKQRNKDVIYENCLEKLRDAVQGAIHFNIIVVDENQNVKMKSVDDLLLDTYKMFLNTNIKMLNSKMVEIDKQINELNILTKIKPSLSETLKKQMDYEESINFINEKTKIEKDIIVSMLGRYRITKLLNLNTDTSILENNKNDLVKNLNNIDKFVLEQYELNND